MRTHLFPVPGPWNGRLAIMARPRGGDWLEDEARSWRRDGIDMVVSLLEEEEETQLSLLEEGNAARSSDVQFISFPIPDRGVPASTQAALTLVTDIERALEAGRNVAIHCRQSIGRAGLIAAAVLVASGVDPDQALETLSSARGAIVPETPEQREWVRRLASVQKLASST